MMQVALVDQVTKPAGINAQMDKVSKSGPPGLQSNMAMGQRPSQLAAWRSKGCLGPASRWTGAARSCMPQVWQRAALGRSATARQKLLWYGNSPSRLLRSPTKSDAPCRAGGQPCFTARDHLARHPGGRHRHQSDQTVMGQYFRHARAATSKQGADAMGGCGPAGDGMAVTQHGSRPDSGRHGTSLMALRRSLHSLHGDMGWRWMEAASPYWPMLQPG